MEKATFEVVEFYEDQGRKCPGCRKQRKQRVKGEVLEFVQTAVSSSEKLAHRAGGRKQG